MVIPWGFGVGALIAATIYYFSGWVVLAWGGKCATCAKRLKEDEEIERLGAILSDDGEVVGMEERTWLSVLQASAQERMEQHGEMDPETNRGAIDQWRAIHDAVTDLLVGYESGRYGYESERNEAPQD